MTTEIDNDEVTNALYAGTLLMSEINSLTLNQYVCKSCSIEESTATGGFRYNFDFESENANRVISFSYSPPTRETKLHCFNVSIEKNDEIVYLDDLITNHKLFDNINYLNLKNHEGGVKQKIYGVVKFIDKIFNEDFKNIINGEEWEHVAFDWQGYK